MSRFPNLTDRRSRFRRFPIDRLVRYLRSLTAPQSIRCRHSIRFPTPNRHQNRIELKEVPQQSMEL
jgi:hypothetical protein